MNALLIVVIVVAVIAVVALAAANPLLKKKEDAAIASAKEELGKPHVVIEPRTTAMGTEPADAGGLRGMGVLAVSSDDLVFVLWAGGETWKLSRSAITSVTTEADSPTEVHKLTLQIHWNDDKLGEVVAMFRLADAVPWLKELGYDWGPDGPPPDDEDDVEESAD